EERDQAAAAIAGEGAPPSHSRATARRDRVRGGPVGARGRVEPPGGRVPGDRVQPPWLAAVPAPLPRRAYRGGGRSAAGCPCCGRGHIAVGRGARTRRRPRDRRISGT